MKLFQKRKIVRAIRFQINDSNEPGVYRTSNFVPKEEFIKYFVQKQVAEKERLKHVSRIKQYSLVQYDIPAGKLMQVLQYCIDDDYLTKVEPEGYRLTSSGARLVSPLFWLPPLPVVASILAIVISGLSYSHSLSTFEKLLPEHQANVVFSEEALMVIPDSEGVSFQPSVKNIGKSAAKKVKFRIYIAPFQRNNPVAIPSYPVRRVYNDKLVADLEPDEQASFGSFSIGRTLTAEDGKLFDAFEVKPDVAILFHLSYIDSLSEKVMSKFFIFHYFYGGFTTNSLIGNDYKIIKEGIVKYLENEGGKDEEFIKFLREN